LINDYSSHNSDRTPLSPVFLSRARRLDIHISIHENDYLSSKDDFEKTLESTRQLLAHMNAPRPFKLIKVFLTADWSGGRWKGRPLLRLLGEGFGRAPNANVEFGISQRNFTRDATDFDEKTGYPLIPGADFEKLARLMGIKVEVLEIQNHKMVTYVYEEGRERQQSNDPP
jgi:hypothetical protein